MTQRDEENLHLFGSAYNSIGRAVNSLCDVRGQGTLQARKIADKLETLAKEIQKEMTNIRES